MAKLLKLRFVTVMLVYGKTTALKSCVKQKLGVMCEGYNQVFKFKYKGESPSVFKNGIMLSFHITRNQVVQVFHP